MSRKHPKRSKPKAKPRARPVARPIADADGDVWGYDPDPPPLPPLPPLPPSAIVMQAEQPSPPPEALVKLGPPPESERDGQRWAYRLLLLQAHEAARDPTISSATRRKEVRVALAAAARVYPDAARAEVAGTIDEDRRQLDARKRAKAQAKLEARPAAGAAKVIPIRRDG